MIFNCFITIQRQNITCQLLLDFKRSLLQQLPSNMDPTLVPKQIVCKYIVNMVKKIWATSRAKPVHKI